MKSRFIDKFIDHVDRVGPEELQGHVLRIVQEMGFLEKVFDALREGVIVTDEEGLIHYLNLAACEFFGIDRRDAIGQPIGSQVKGLDWDQLTESGRVVNRDLEVFYPENRYINFYVAPLKDDDEAAAEGFVLLLRDTTQSRQLREEELESEKMNALTMLAAGVAHEIGNPLNSLNIHLQLVQRKLKKVDDQALREEVDELLEVARGEIQRLDFIVEKFLSAVRPTQPRIESVDLNDLVQNAVKFMAAEIQDRGINVKLKLNPDVPNLPLDKDQMKQALYNLIRNACQAIGSDGELEIDVDKDDFNVSIRIADSGPGITAEEVGKVFEPYFTTKKAGSGLGLLIVRRIVREHGGEVEFNSEEGKGATVTIFLPRIDKRMRLLPGPGDGSVEEGEVIEVESIGEKIVEEKKSKK
ncbi:MAG: PAS domain-containing protein [Verrucomicrobia bacterium]|nr:PAS domain-containing protein [Verrucomicrobiota bacterium]